MLKGTNFDKPANCGNLNAYYRNSLIHKNLLDRFHSKTMERVTKLVIPSDGHDKPFCTKSITIIDNFKNALGDTDKSQFSKTISIIDKLLPINFSDKCCGIFSMCV